MPKGLLARADGKTPALARKEEGVRWSTPPIRSGVGDTSLAEEASMAAYGFVAAAMEVGLVVGVL
jgi:hypothetical protein